MDMKILLGQDVMVKSTRVNEEAQTIDLVFVGNDGEQEVSIPIEEFTKDSNKLTDMEKLALDYLKLKRFNKIYWTCDDGTILRFDQELFVGYDNDNKMVKMYNNRGECINEFPLSDVVVEVKENLNLK